MRKYLALLSFCLIVSACTPIPEGLKAVDGFELERFLGKWHEIARLDNTFERGLENITATYSKRDDGGVRVVNRGYNVKRKRWEDAEGRGYPIESTNIGRLKVTFFGPIYGAFNIIALDKTHYQYAVICGNTRDSLWIMSRTTTIDDQLFSEIRGRLAEQGFATDKLIMVDHSAAPPAL
ncbi:MAG: lipocalin family protein [Gammaproteobacteria bacterium]|nr:lipocalin family protein [Gammaproteobacteria bacterium]